MRNRNFYTLIMALCCMASAFNVAGQIYDPVKKCVIDANGACVPGTILSAVPFLRITPDARSGAMGDVGLATSVDPSAMHFNASKLAFVERDLSLSASYTPWLRDLGLNDVYLAYLSGYKKVDDFQAIGFGFRFFSLGDINFTDTNGNPSGIGRPREMEVSFAYARKLTEKFSAGLTGKYIYSNLASGQQIGGIDITSANAFAADISFSYKSNVGEGDNALAVGMAITNLGSKVSYTNSAIKDFIPGNLGIGAAYTMALDDFNSLTFAADINKLLVPSPIPSRIIDDNGVEDPNPDYDKNNNMIADYREKATFSGILGSFGDAQGGFTEELRELSYSLGIEYWYDKQFAVRAGYFYENELKGDRKYLTVGVGLKYNVFGINLSYLVPTNNRRNPLDNTLRFTLNFDFETFTDGNP